MGKLRNIIWSGYNGWFWGRASRKGRKIFKTFTVICHVKLKNLITLQKFHECADLVKNIRMNCCDFCINFPLATLIFFR